MGLVRSLVGLACGVLIACEGTDSAETSTTASATTTISVIASSIAATTETVAVSNAAVVDTDAHVLIRIETRTFGAPDYTVPGPWFSLYPDGKVIAWNHRRGWFTATATGDQIADLISAADEAGLLDTPVVDGEQNPDDYGRVLVLAANDAALEHVDYSTEPTTSSEVSLDRYMTTLDQFAEDLPGKPWKPQAWIGFTRPGCLDFVDPPADRLTLSARPIMPDLVDADLETITYGHSC
jgi:hypothetical protein